jgi:hypothetical protein
LNIRSLPLSRLYSQGDNHNAQPSRFKRFIELAKRNGGQFNLNAANSFYAQNARDSMSRNDKLYFQAYTVSRSTFQPDRVVPELTQLFFASLQIVVVLGGKPYSTCCRLFHMPLFSVHS